RRARTSGGPGLGMSPTWLAGTPAGRLAGPPVPGEVPVVPDRETARRWAEHELRDPVYHERPSLLDRIREWLSDLFQGADVALDPGAAALIVVGVLVVVLAVALFVAGPVRLRR